MLFELIITEQFAFNFMSNLCVVEEKNEEKVKFVAHQSVSNFYLHLQE